MYLLKYLIGGPVRKIIFYYLMNPEMCLKVVWLSWNFGFKPKIEFWKKITFPHSWGVANLLTVTQTDRGVYSLLFPCIHIYKKTASFSRLYEKLGPFYKKLKMRRRRADSLISFGKSDVMSKLNVCEQAGIYMHCPGSK